MELNFGKKKCLKNRLLHSISLDYTWVDVWTCRSVSDTAIGGKGW